MVPRETRRVVVNVEDKAYTTTAVHRHSESLVCRNPKYLAMSREQLLAEKDRLYAQIKEDQLRTPIGGAIVGGVAGGLAAVALASNPVGWLIAIGAGVGALFNSNRLGKTEQDRALASNTMEAKDEQAQMEINCIDNALIGTSRDFYDGSVRGSMSAGVSTSTADKVATTSYTCPYNNTCGRIMAGNLPAVDDRSSYSSSYNTSTNNGYANNGYANNGYANNGPANNGYSNSGYMNSGYTTSPYGSGSADGSTGSSSGSYYGSSNYSNGNDGGGSGSASNDGGSYGSTIVGQSESMANAAYVGASNSYGPSDAAAWGNSPLETCLSR